MTNSKFEKILIIRKNNLHTYLFLIQSYTKYINTRGKKTTLKHTKMLTLVNTWWQDEKHFSLYIFYRVWIAFISNNKLLAEEHTNQYFIKVFFRKKSYKRLSRAQRQTTSKQVRAECEKYSGKGNCQENLSRQNLISKCWKSAKT